MTLALSIGDVAVGEAIFFIDDLFPGNNTFPLTAKLDTASVEGNITEILETEIPYLQRDLIRADATGVMVEYEGRRITYLEEALQNITVTAIRPVKPLLQSLVDSAFSLLIGQDQPNEFLGDIINSVADNLLDTVKNLKEEDVDEYTESLGNVAQLALRVLTLLGLA